MRALADNPLLLTVMIIVHFNVGRLPERRADLYDNATELLLGWDTRWRRTLAAPPPGWTPSSPPRSGSTWKSWPITGSSRAPRRRGATRPSLFCPPRFSPAQGEEKAAAGRRAGRRLCGLGRRAQLPAPPAGPTLAFYRRAFQEYLAARRLAREPDPAGGRPGGAGGELGLVAGDGAPGPRSPQRQRPRARRHAAAGAAGRAGCGRMARTGTWSWPGAPWPGGARAPALAARGGGARPPARGHRAGHARLCRPAARAGRAALAVLGDDRPGVCERFPLLVEVPGGPFAMGSPPREVARWKEWVRRASSGAALHSRRAGQTSRLLRSMPPGWTPRRACTRWTCPPFTSPAAR